MTNLQSPGPAGARGGPGQQRRRPTTRSSHADADLRRADRGHRDRRGPELRVPPDRPGRRPGRRRAGREHPRRLPVPHRPRAWPSSTARAATRRPPTTVRRRPSTVPSCPSAPAASIPPTPRSTNSRKPLAGEFTYNGQRLFVVANHFNSKGGDEPLFGRFQPPTLAQRGRSARSRRRSSTTSSTQSWPSTPRERGRARRPERLRVLGTAGHPQGGRGPEPALDTLPREPSATPTSSRATPRTLDHILVSRQPARRPRRFDVVHVNAEFAVQVERPRPGLCAVRSLPGADRSQRRPCVGWAEEQRRPGHEVRYPDRAAEERHPYRLGSAAVRHRRDEEPLARQGGHRLLERGPGRVDRPWGRAGTEGLNEIGTNPDNTKCTPGHNNAVGLRLYYDATTRASRFDLTITPDPSVDEFLRSDGNACANAESTGVTTRFLSLDAPTATSAKCKDSSSINFAGGNLFRVIGTWSAPPQL